MNMNAHTFYAFAVASARQTLKYEARQLAAACIWLSMCLYGRPDMVSVDVDE